MKKSFLKFVGISMLAFGLINAARAGTVLWLSLDTTIGNGDDILVYDGLPGDSNPNGDVITWVGSIGVWNINVSTGLVTNGGSNPSIDFNSVNHSTAAGDLYMAFSANGFGPSVGGSLNQSVGGTTAGSVEFISTTGNSTLLNWGLPWVYQTFSGGSFSGDGSASPTYTNPFNITQWAYIHHTGAGTTSFDAVTSVPEGGSTALMVGLSLVGLSLAASYRRKVA